MDDSNQREIDRLKTELEMERHRNEYSAKKAEMIGQMMANGVKMLEKLTDAMVRFEEKKLDAEIAQQDRATVALEKMAAVFDRMAERDANRASLEKLIDEKLKTFSAGQDSMS